MPFTPDSQRLGLRSDVLACVVDTLEAEVSAGRIHGAALAIARRGLVLSPRFFGRESPEPDAAPVGEGTLFLVASLTKPVTATAVMRLVERGRVGLDDRVVEHIPEFGSHGKERVRVRHLLSHTSGLPDMLPDNEDLRRNHAPLDAFVARICDLTLDFEPGAAIRYQSCGYAILGEIVRRVAGRPLPDFLRTEVFDPLLMHDSRLGLEASDVLRRRVARVRLPAPMVGMDWGWNSPYWHALAAPWGGMFSTVMDMIRLCRCMFGGGELEGARLLGPAAVDAMTRDQGPELDAHAERRRARRAWGLGWEIVPRTDASYYGDLLSPGSYGHAGATGTTMWVDPTRELVCCLFTTEPLEQSARLLGRCSTLVAAAAT